MTRQVQILPTIPKLIEAATDRTVQILKTAIAQNGIATIALSGGSTPKLLFRLLAQSPYKNNIPWKKIIFAFGDERFVPHSSEESNYKMAVDFLFNLVAVPKKTGPA